VDVAAPNHVASQRAHTLTSSITMVLHVRTTEAKTVPPPFITTSTSPEAHLSRLAKVIAKAKRIVVVCGESHLD
jgi:thiamine pyrophosphate-dependent acetolactate synthase large subunit-like protein